MNDRVRLFRREDVFNSFAIADIGLDELVAGQMIDGLEIFEVARVGEFIEVDDLVGPVVQERHAHETGADEACAAGNDEFHLCCNSQS